MRKNEERRVWAIRSDTDCWLTYDHNEGTLSPGIAWCDNKSERRVFVASRRVALAFLAYVNSVCVFRSRLVIIGGSVNE